MAAKICFVPVTIIRNAVNIKGDSMQRNSEKQIIYRLPKYDSKHFSNQWYFS